MEVFTIVANEVIGLSATECTLMQFSYNPEQIHDPETVLRSAVMDYLKTDEGKRQLEINCGCWNWGDIDFYSGELYLNAIGDVVSGCDWSYKSQKKYRFGNVMNKNWLENISNSELYIAS